VLLVGKFAGELELRLPEYLIAPVGDFRVLVHPVTSFGLRRWRKTGEMMGLLKGEVDMWRVPGIITSYGSKRRNKREDLYRQTFWAYYAAIERRKQRGQKGGRGLLVETAKILEKEYGWAADTDSYIVRRYLDRAEKIWHVSAR
jgi:hypothetical protein